MEQLHYLLMKANAALSRRILAGAAGLGLTPGQPKVLEFLSTAGEAAMEIFRRTDHAAASELSEQELDILKKALSKIASSLTADMKKDR